MPLSNPIPPVLREDKDIPLTHSEMDFNFKSLLDELVLQRNLITFLCSEFSSFLVKDLLLEPISFYSSPDDKSYFRKSFPHVEKLSDVDTTVHHTLFRINNFSQKILEFECFYDGTNTHVNSKYLYFILYDKNFTPTSIEGSMVSSDGDYSFDINVPSNDVFYVFVMHVCDALTEDSYNFDFTVRTLV